MLPSPESLPEIYRFRFPTNAYKTPTIEYMQSVRYRALLRFNRVGPTSSLAITF